MEEPGLEGYLGERFRFARLLGKGGFGEVYEVTPTSGGARLALKVLERPLDGWEDFERRFLREVKNARRLRHPHAVAVLDHGALPDGRLWYTMELCEGPSLAEVLEQGGPLEPARAVRLVAQALEALGAAHALGLVHRDVKPANVHVVPVGAGDEAAKVLDLGLAKEVASGRASQMLTAEGTVLGTLEYMAPEQLQGQRLDGRADLYATACMLFELLDGHRPFRATTADRLIRQHLAEAPPPLAAAVPAALGVAIARGLAKRPEERFATAEAMAEALLQALPDARAWRPRPGAAARAGAYPAVAGGGPAGARAVPPTRVGSAADTIRAPTSSGGPDRTIPPTRAIDAGDGLDGPRTPTEENAPVPLGLADTVVLPKVQGGLAPPVPPTRRTAVEEALAAAREQEARAAAEAASRPGDGGGGGGLPPTAPLAAPALPPTAALPAAATPASPAAPRPALAPAADTARVKPASSAAPPPAPVRGAGGPELPLGGRYVLVRPLAERTRGRRAQSFEALDRTTGQMVWLALLSGDGPATDEDTWRYVRGVNALSRIEHPHVVRFLDAGAAPDGRLYYVTEWVPGDSLAGWLDAMRAADVLRVPPPHAAGVTCQLLEGLAAVHAHAIVHRDVTPSHVLVAPVEGGAVAKLTGFGLARAVLDAEGVATSWGLPIGTPRYMAPEQLLGQRLDARADIFAAGVVLYEMLAGRPPFPGEELRQIAPRVLRDPTPPLPPEVEGPARAALDAILATALAKDPGARFPSALTMRQALLPIAGALAWGDLAALDATPRARP